MSGNRQLPRTGTSRAGLPVTMGAAVGVVGSVLPQLMTGDAVSPLVTVVVTGVGAFTGLAIKSTADALSSSIFACPKLGKDAKLAAELQRMYERDAFCPSSEAAIRSDELLQRISPRAISMYPLKTGSDDVRAEAHVTRSGVYLAEVHVRADGTERTNWMKAPRPPRKLTLLGWKTVPAARHVRTDRAQDAG